MNRSTHLYRQWQKSLTPEDQKEIREGSLNDESRKFIYWLENKVLDSAVTIQSWKAAYKAAKTILYNVYNGLEKRELYELNGELDELTNNIKKP